MATEIGLQMVASLKGLQRCDMTKRLNLMFDGSGGKTMRRTLLVSMPLRALQSSSIDKKYDRGLDEIDY